MVIRSRLCKNANCKNPEIIWSDEYHAYISVNTKKLHRLECDWIPHNNGNNKPKSVEQLILISSKDFETAIKSIDDQFKSTQAAIASVASLSTECKCKIDSILRGN